MRIDLRKPLERGRALHLLGRTHCVVFKYEKLPIFCFNCGRILHEVQGCPSKRGTGRRSEEEEKQLGVWLRAEAPRQMYGGGKGEGYALTGE